MADYSFFSKLIHYMALNSQAARKVAFEIDCMMSHLRRTSEITAPPVHIAGLARSGTTILLEALYSTGVFASLTYRHMPFVMAPLIWRLITAGQQRSIELKERAHGDRLYVNFDSPEAFEEIFWLTFADYPYVKKLWLEPHDSDSQVLENYQSFVENVLKSCSASKSTRYLAKNNNNILRIRSLKIAFPHGDIIVPFRNPYDQARSLHRQHQNFLKVHTEDSFSLRYMNWLGHFEFGMNFRPFKVNEEVVPESGEQLNDIDYWFGYWKNVYQFVIERYGDDVIFFDYDQFCAEPAVNLDMIAKLLSLDSSRLIPFCDKVKHAVYYSRETQKVPEFAQKVHRELQEVSKQSQEK
jgi:hypothetical protein